MCRNGAGAALNAAPAYHLEAVVHVELDRVRGHAQARDVFHLEVDVAVDHLVGENVAGGEEVTVGVERLECLVE